MANARNDSGITKVKADKVPVTKLGKSNVAGPSGKSMLTKLLADAGIGGNPEDGSSA